MNEGKSDFLTGIVVTENKQKVVLCTSRERRIKEMRVEKSLGSKLDKATNTATPPPYFMFEDWQKGKNFKRELET